jgi:hypothetical protein
MLLAAAALSVAAFVVTLLGAQREPYFGQIRKSDALIQVGIGCTLIALWLLWSLTATWLVLRRRWRPLTLLSLAWATLCVSYLAHSVHAYLDDITRFQQGTYPGGPNWSPPPPTTSPRS